MLFALLLLVMNVTLQAEEMKMDHSKHESMSTGSKQMGTTPKGVMQHESMDHDTKKHETMNHETMSHGQMKHEHDNVDKMSQHKGHHVTPGSDEGKLMPSQSKLSVLEVIPVSGKVREGGYDDRYFMESTSAYDAIKDQCAKASRGLVILDRKSWDKCSVKTRGITQ